MTEPGETHTVDGDRYEWRGEFRDDELEALHAEAFNHAPTDADWAECLHRHSLGWVCAWRGDNLIGFVNVAWDWASPSRPDTDLCCFLVLPGLLELSR